MKRRAIKALPSILLTELKQIKRWRKIAINGHDPEGVHQLRVSLRRMRTAFTVFTPVLQPDYRQHWRRKLKYLAKLLDKARDLDVFLETHYPDSSTDSALKHLLRSQKKQQHQNLAKQLQSKSFNKLYRKLKKQLKNNHWASQHGQHHSILTSNLAQQQLQQHYDRVLQLQSGLDLNDEIMLHQLRIRIKQLRYGCELLAPILQSTNTGFITAMKALQDDLGLIHDASVQQTMLTSLPDQTQHEFMLILSATKNTSQQLKSTLETRLETFTQLALPWDGIRKESESD